MKKKIKIIILLAVLLANNHGYAQNAQGIQSELSQIWLGNRPTVIQQSPQSAIFEQYTKHEVSECNGLPQISIPLYTISIKGLEIPVSLNYHASGIKFRQYDGDVGAGWSLSVGGYRISRTVKGLPDEISTRAQLSEYSLYEKEITESNKDAANRFFLSIGSQDIKYDPEYDVFTYMLPSSTGHYVLDYDSVTRKAFILEPKLDRKAFILEPNLDTIALGNIPEILGNKFGYADWTITDGAGFKYFMGSPDGSETYIEKNSIKSRGRCAVGWPLRKIESPYKQNINFSYVQHEKYLYPNSSSLSNLCISEADAVGNPSKHSIIASVSNGSCTPFDDKMLFVQNISTGQETILFERTGSGTIPYRLNKITVKDKSGNVVRSVQLDYEIQTKESRHLLLKSVAVSGGSAAPAEIKKYTFDYYLHPESDERKIYPDLYGYYHYGTYSGGKGNQIYEQYANSYFNEQLKIIQTLNSVSSAGIVFWTAAGGLPNSDFPRWYDRSRQASDVPDSYTLKTITYPTGGSVRYEYEANEIGGNYTGGLRVKKISSFANNGTIPDIVTKYKYSGGVANINTVISYLDFIDQFYTARAYENNVLQINRNLQISGDPILPELGDYKTGYERVEVSQHSGADENETLGKTVFGFEVPREYFLDGFGESLYFYNYGEFAPGDKIKNLYKDQPEFGTAFVGKYSYGYSPVLKSKQVFDKENRLLRDESLYYQKISHHEVQRIKTKRKIVFPVEIQNYENPTIYVKSQFSHKRYIIEGGSYRLTRKTVTDYGPADNLNVHEYYTYNDFNLLSKTDTQSNADGPIIKEYTYSRENKGMKDANIVNTVIKTETKRNEQTIGQVKTNYPATAVNGMFLPLSVETASTGNLRTDLTYDKYDALGNLLQYTSIDGIPVVYLWGYSRSYPIAEIRNATYAQVAAILGETLIERVAAAIVPTGADLQQVDNLRSNPALKEAGVATYTYQPLVGMLSETSPSGQTTCYSYDDMGRLTETYIVEGGKKKLLEYNKYNYKNQ